MNSNFNTRRFARTIVLLGSIAAATLLSGCAGLQVGPGTTTGAGLGAVIGGLSSRDPVGGIVRGGIIGGAIGAIGDAANGVPPVQSGGYYDRDGRYYDNRPIIIERPVPVYRDRPIIIERRQPQPYWDNYCGCRRYR
jgi:hypothetical protein